VAELAEWDVASSVSDYQAATAPDVEYPRCPSFPSSSFKEERSGYAWVLAALLGLLVVSRFAGLTHQSLWYDEGYTAILGASSSFHQFWSRFGSFTTSEHLQPLYYLLIFLWTRIAGVSDAALRAPSAVFSIGSGVAACIAVKALTGGRSKVVLLATAALIASSFSLYYAQEARPYALLQFLAFLMLAAFLRNRAADQERGPSLAAQLGFGLACGLCFLGSPFTTLLVLCVAFADLLVTSSWTRWLRLWSVPAVCSAVLFLGYLIPALKTMPTFIAQDVTAIKQPLWMNVGYAIYGIVFGTTLQPAPSLLRGSQRLHVVLSCWPVILPAIVTLLLLAVGAYLLIRHARQLPPQVTASLLALALYGVLLFGFFGAVGHLNVLPRHSSALFALLFIAVAAAATLMEESGSTAGRAVFVLGLAGWLVLNCVSIVGYVSDPAFRKDDYRAAALALRGYSVPIFVVAGQPRLLKRYGAVTRDATEVDPDQLASDIETRSGRADQVVLVFNQFRNYRWEAMPQDPSEVMAPDYACQNVTHVSNIDIYVCRNLASKQVSDSESGQVTNLSHLHAASSNGRTQVRSLGITSRL
jgi:4-amino-4-deoxy-L-arabinose transferase-like glycosyltransferase